MTNKLFFIFIFIFFITITTGCSITKNIKEKPSKRIPNRAIGGVGYRVLVEFTFEANKNAVNGKLY